MAHTGIQPVSRATWKQREGVVIADTSSLTVLGGYQPGYITVYIEGRRLNPSEYTAENGSAVSFAQTLPAGTNYLFEVIQPFSPQDAYTKAEADGKFATYEEGVWVPAFALQGGFINALGTERASRYIKTGNKVTLFSSFYLGVSGTGNTGTLEIGGLPFPVGAPPNFSGGDGFIYNSIGSAANAIGTIAARTNPETLYAHFERTSGFTNASAEASIRAEYIIDSGA